MKPTTHNPHAAIEAALQQRAFAQAGTLAAARVRAAPHDAEAWRLLGAALSGAGRAQEAVTAIRRASAMRPNDARVHNSLGNALHLAGDRAGAIDALRRASELAPDFAPAWMNLATLLIAEENNVEALRALDVLLALEPASLQARILRSDVLRNTLPGEQVVAEYRRMIADHPDSAWAWYGLANIKTVPVSAQDLTQMQRLHAAKTAPGDRRERMALAFALATAMEDNGRCEQAFAYLAEANALARSGVPWDAAAFSATVDAVLRAFPTAAHASDTLGGETIFIVSLPRSGSTLVEQILASHSRIAGGGELPHLEDLLGAESRRHRQGLTQWAARADADAWERLGREYVHRAQSRRDGRERLTDKTPANWLYCGAALAMLPQARIVNVRRDPLESGFSCYKQLFPGASAAFSYALEDIAAYWRDYDRACRHWQAQYPQRFFDLSYEQLQAEPERVVRELLAFCGFEFEADCLRFHENRRSVATFSAAQVRQPLRRNTARTAKYGALLDPLRTALGMPAYVPTDDAVCGR